jgi:hypothetical protein
MTRLRSVPSGVYHHLYHRQQQCLLAVLIPLEHLCLETDYVLVRTRVPGSE